MVVPFAKPDITRKDQKAVLNVLKSHWITSGKVLLEFEESLKNFEHAKDALCFSSATSALELLCISLGLQKGDEVIMPCYTYTATASAVLHTGAKVIFTDINKDDYHINLKDLEKKINSHTKAIITVDIAGVPCAYKEILEILKSKKAFFHPRKGTLQEFFSTFILISDSAHALGARYFEKSIINQVDFSIVSFHAVKNLTTAEGGALFFSPFLSLDVLSFKQQLKRLALHGQTKDAFSKYKSNQIEYDILEIAHKANLSDLCSALGLSQLKRYDKMLLKREKLYHLYQKFFEDKKDFVLFPQNTKFYKGSFHLAMLSCENWTFEEKTNAMLRLKEKNIASNVHFKPLPLMTAYKNLGYRIEDFPVAFDRYQKELTLPLHSSLSKKQIHYVLKEFEKILN